jgi:hypothetical protein
VVIALYFLPVHIQSFTKRPMPILQSRSDFSMVGRPFKAGAKGFDIMFVA